MASQTIQFVNGVQNRPLVQVDRNGSINTVRDVLNAFNTTFNQGQHKVMVNGAETSIDASLPPNDGQTIRVILTPGAPKNAA